MKALDTPLYDATAHSELIAIEEYRFFRIEDVRYLAVPLPSSLQVEYSKHEIAPLIVLGEHARDELTRGRLGELADRWLRHDDVFRSEFLENIIFVASPDSTLSETTVKDILPLDWGTKWSAVVRGETAGHKVEPGPYVMWKGELCKIFRLYDDSHQAFVIATKPPLDSGPYDNLHMSGDFYTSLSVAVPSRVSTFDTAESPLAGARFAVKDLFMIEGLRLTVGCRAWYDLAQPAPLTSPVLGKLIDKGAHLIGTLKLGSLITREEPTESADYQAPFNPRGDGYQSAWSSSGGSGAAIASYDWLDFTLGTDTTGSSRRPALANGAFQIRVSKNALPFEGIVPSWTPFDSPAMFTRDIVKMQRWTGAWLSAKEESYRSPVSIIFPSDFWPVSNKAQMDLVDRFVEDLESFHGVKKTQLLIKDLWKETAPSEADNGDVEHYLKDVGITSFCYGVYHELDQFRQDYQERYSKEPYVNPVMRWRWNAAKNVTQEQHEDAVNRLKVYKDWLLKEVLQVGKQDSIIVLPITTQAVDYRDEATDPPTAPSAFDGIWLAPILGAPELSLPIGEMQYHSKVRQKTEHLPIVVSLLGAPGTDMKLIDAARRTLEASGRPISVTTGSRMYTEDQYVSTAVGH